MEKETNRFADKGYILSDFATHFVVHCPKCSGKAHVGRDKKLTCTACFHVERPGRWYGSATAYLSVKCRECHETIRRSADWDGQWKKLHVRCEHCGDECSYDAQVSIHDLHEGLMTDPVYGLPLWLQKNFRENLFWSFNYEHLSILRDFIGAKLRERGIDPRNTISKNSSMIGRLPDFIKKAAHREDLLRMIDQLEKKEK